MTTESKTKVIAFTRLRVCNGIFYGDGDDGATWAFTREGEDWVAEAVSNIPLDAQATTLAVWDQEGLPRTLDVPDDSPVTEKLSGYRRVGTTIPFVVVPCDLVVPNIRLRATSGGAAVHYDRVDVSTEQTPIPGTNDKTEVDVKQTTRRIEAIDEFQAMDALRSRMRSHIKAVCAKTVIGLLSPKSHRKQLRDLISATAAEIAQVNAGTTFYKVSSGVIVASIETDANVAAATVTEALRDAMEALTAAIQQGDVEQMREIVTGLKGFDALVDGPAADKVREAISEARKIATFVTKETEQKGRKLEEVLSEVSTAAIDAVRFVLLDTSGAKSVTVNVPEIGEREIEVVVPPKPSATDEVEEREVEQAGQISSDDGALAAAPRG